MAEKSGNRKKVRVGGEAGKKKTPGTSAGKAGGKAGAVSSEKKAAVEDLKSKGAKGRSAIRGNEQAEVSDEALEAQMRPPEISGERLYYLGVGRYVQHDGKGPEPAALTDFVARHGEPPPYMPLPRVPVDFLMSDGVVRSDQIYWSGKGALPADVLEYVCENGTLPRYRMHAPELGGLEL